MTAMTIQGIQQYLDTAYQRTETWKTAHPNHTQDELEAVSNTFYDEAYAEFTANTLNKGPRLDYLHLPNLDMGDSHV
jgi:hypothetical protein